LRTVTEGMLQILMEADVEGQIGAGRHERSAERLTYRNGATGSWIPGWAHLSCASRSFAKARTFRRS
jgi:hypothetical protein